MSAEGTITKTSFDDWWLRYRQLAEQVELPVGDAVSYFEYFADGDSPEDAIAAELGYWEQAEKGETP